MTETEYETVWSGWREKVPLSKKLNPLWWLMNGDSWTAPLENNGAPYLPNVKNQLLRNFYWWCRNPIANFVGYVMGVEDQDYFVSGQKPVMMTTWRDWEPRGERLGWKWAYLRAPQSWLSILMAWAIIFALIKFETAVALDVAAWLVVIFLCFRFMGILPFASYYGGRWEFYLGWRPYSGGFGWKLVRHAGFGAEDKEG